MNGVVFLIFFFLIAAGFFAWRSNYLSIKGKIGELKVASLLFFLPKDKYIVLNDLFFKFGDHTTQIDHLVISVFGLFVIETKNYKGWIFGSSSKERWTQNIWGNKYSLFNPIFQNESHIRFLKRNFKEINSISNFIYPVVVFLKANRLVLYGDCDCVLWGSELNKYIHNFKSEVLSREYCEQLAALLLKNNIRNKKVRRQHRINVEVAKSFAEDKVRNGKCPRCGGELVHRSGIYGDFFGCSNYPSCKYTRDFI